MLKYLRDLPWNWYAVAIAVIIIDQLTKQLASQFLLYNDAVNLFPGFNLTLRHNLGAAFSFFADAGGWQVWILGGLAAVVSVALVVWIARRGKVYHPETLALALILGGAVGNLIDRVLFEYVIDFIEVYFKSYYWPAFNVADSAIFCGAALMIYDAVFGKK